MKTTPQTPTFRIHAIASTAHVAGRLAVVAAIVAALAGGFLAGLATPEAPADQLARSTQTCQAYPC